MLRFGLQFWHRHFLKPRHLILALLAYVVFAIAPHDYWLHHEHAGGGQTHDHSVSTLHQANLERQVMAALSGSHSEMEDRLSSTEDGDAIANQEMSSVTVSSVDLQGASGLHATLPAVHSHFFSDANLVVLLFALCLIWVLLGKTAHANAVFPSIPSLRLLPAAARGPPTFG
jgi:hypothetical protein